MGAGIGIPPPVHTPQNNTRRFARVRLHMVRCSLGDLRDLSQAGARVITRGLRSRAQGEFVELLVQGVDGEIRLRAEVVRTRRLGLFRHELGLSFKELSPEIRAALVGLARSVPMNESLARGDDRRVSA